MKVWLTDVSKHTKIIALSSLFADSARILPGFDAIKSERHQAYNRLSSKPESGMEPPCIWYNEVPITCEEPGPYKVSDIAINQCEYDSFTQQ